MEMRTDYWTPELLTHLRCLGCGENRLRISAETLSCTHCEGVYPLRSGRFPDFLTDEQRQGLQRELEFWASHFQGVEYADESDQSYRQWSDWMQVRAEDRALEIGCGSGALLLRLPCSIKFGLEPAENLLVPSKGFLGVMGSAENLPFASASFDLVFFKHSLHHVVDKAAALKEAARVLRPGGRLFVMEPNARHPQRRLISNPTSLMRRMGLLSRMIGPVETFQRASEVREIALSCGLEMRVQRFVESQYERLTTRQALQKLYSRLLKGILPEELLLPNYFIGFSKPPARP